MPKFILVTSPKGGVGKSTVAQGLAVSAALAGLKVAIADFDRQQSILRWCRRRPSNVSKVDAMEGRWDAVDGISAATAQHDIVVIDTPTSVEEHIGELKALLQLSSVILVPTGYSWADRESVVPWMKTVKAYAPAAFVLNRVRTVKALVDARRDLNRTGLICPVEIPTYEDVWQAQEVGLSACEIDRAKGGQDIASIWEFSQNLMRQEVTA